MRLRRESHCPEVHLLLVASWTEGWSPLLADEKAEAGGPVRSHRDGSGGSLVGAQRPHANPWFRLGRGVPVREDLPRDVDVLSPRGRVGHRRPQGQSAARDIGDVT